MSDQLGAWPPAAVSGMAFQDYRQPGSAMTSISGLMTGQEGVSGSLLSMASSPIAQQVAPKLKVAHVGTTFVRGGIESWLRTIVKHTNRFAVDRCVVTSSSFIDPSVAEEVGVPLVVGQRDAVCQAARECDVLLCWGPEELAEWLDQCRPKLCIMIAHSEHHLTRRIIERMNHLADAVVAVSQRVRERLSFHPRTAVIPHGVDASGLAPARSRREIRESLGFGADDFVVGFVGRFFPEKSPEVVIETLAALPKSFKGLFVGWGPMHDHLMAMANHTIPCRYAFRKAFSNVGDYYHAMDALCVPSKEEGFGLVILEAMMCGVPVITTNVGCVPELITNGISGLVVEQSTRAFKEAAQLLAAEPALRSALVARARAIADERGHARPMVERYETLIDALWKDKHGALVAGKAIS